MVCAGGVKMGGSEAELTVGDAGLTILHSSVVPVKQTASKHHRVITARRIEVQLQHN